jgi:hypothetical protein
LTPVVTAIPSLRALTADGAVGALWRCGDARSFGEALRRAALLGPGHRRRVRAHFDEHLSSPAIGRQFNAAYARIMEQRFCLRARLAGA